MADEQRRRIALVLNDINEVTDLKPNELLADFNNQDLVLIDDDGNKISLTKLLKKQIAAKLGGDHITSDNGHNCATLENNGYMSKEDKAFLAQTKLFMDNLEHIHALNNIFTTGIVKPVDYDIENNVISIHEINAIINSKYVQCHGNSINILRPNKDFISANGEIGIRYDLVYLEVYHGVVDDELLTFSGVKYRENVDFTKFKHGLGSIIDGVLDISFMPYELGIDERVDTRFAYRLSDYGQDAPLYIAGDGSPESKSKLGSYSGFKFAIPLFKISVANNEWFNSTNINGKTTEGLSDIDISQLYTIYNSQLNLDKLLMYYINQYITNKIWDYQQYKPVIKQIGIGDVNDSVLNIDLNQAPNEELPMTVAPGVGGLVLERGLSDYPVVYTIMPSPLQCIDIILDTSKSYGNDELFTLTDSYFSKLMTLRLFNINDFITLELVQDDSVILSTRLLKETVYNIKLVLTDYHAELYIDNINNVIKAVTRTQAYTIANMDLSVKHTRVSRISISHKFTEEFVDMRNVIASEIYDCMDKLAARDIVLPIDLLSDNALVKCKLKAATIMSKGDTITIPKGMNQIITGFHTDNNGVNSPELYYNGQQLDVSFAILPDVMVIVFNQDYEIVPGNRIVDLKYRSVFINDYNVPPNIQYILSDNNIAYPISRVNVDNSDIKVICGDKEYDMVDGKTMYFNNNIKLKINTKGIPGCVVKDAKLSLNIASNSDTIPYKCGIKSGNIRAVKGMIIPTNLVIERISSDTRDGYLYLELTQTDFIAISDIKCEIVASYNDNEVFVSDHGAIEVSNGEIKNYMNKPLNGTQLVAMEQVETPYDSNMENITMPYTLAGVVFSLVKDNSGVIKLYVKTDKEIIFNLKNNLIWR